MNEYPMLISDVEIYESDSILKKHKTYILGSKSLDRSIKIDVSKLDFIKELKLLLNGKNNIEEIKNILQLKKYPIEIESLLELFARNGFIEGTIPISNSEVDLASKKLFDIPCSNNFHKYQKICNLLIHLYPYLIIVSIVFMLCNISLLSELILNKEVLFLSFLVSFVTVLIHEFGHLIFAIAKNIHIDRIRVSFLWGIMPMVYVKYFNLYFIPAKQRLILILSGVLTNFGCAMISLFIYYYNQSPLAASFFYVNILYIIGCLYPHQLTDGYFALSTLFEKHNLRLEIIQSLFKRKKDVNFKIKTLIFIYVFLVLSSAILAGKVLYEVVMTVFENELKEYSYIIILLVSALVIYQLLSIFFKMKKEFKYKSRKQNI